MGDVVRASPDLNSRDVAGMDLRRRLMVAAGVAVGLGLLGALVALAADRDVSSTVAATYYIIGCVLFLVGMFPSGGYSLLRGTTTRRRPMGSRFEPTLILGLALIGVGVIVDLAVLV
jgi:hypothetical protein